MLSSQTASACCRRQLRRQYARVRHFHPSAAASESSYHAPQSARTRLRPYVTFALGTSAASFGLAVWWTSYDTSKRIDQLDSMRSRLSLFSSRSEQRPSNEALESSRLYERIERAKRLVRSFPRDWHLPTVLAEWYAAQSEAKLATAGLLAAFVPPFLVWQIPSARSFATRYLWHHPTVTRPLTLLTSVFSHRTLLHIGFNSLALWGFGSMAHTWFAKVSSLESPDVPRSTSTPEFWSFFVSAGLVSSLASHVYSVRVLVPRMLANAAAATATSTRLLPSLGASGAVYGCLAICALGFPQLSVSLVFLPFIPIPIGTAFTGMVAMDILGIIRGWRTFDHVAHLTGALSGVAYWILGHDMFNDALGVANRAYASSKSKDAAER